MAGSSSAPALVATFVFGLVVLAASAAIFFFVKANRSPLIRDELRLALSFFLSASALWGILDFATTLVHENAVGACQTVVSFAAVFDQVARVSVEQFLLWAANGGIKVTKLSLAMQGTLLVRFILGAAFVGVQRSQFEPVCVATNSVLPIGVIIMVTDIVMVAALSTKIVLEKKGNAVRPELTRSNALIFVTAGLGIWTGLSIPLFLGLKASGLVVRTIPPAIGLLILIGAVALSMKNFASSTSGSGLQIQKTVSFESTSHIEEPTREVYAQAFPPQNVTTRVAGVLPVISQPATGQATRGMGGLPVEGELFPPMRVQAAAPPRVHHKKQMSDRAFNGGKVVISKPIVPAGTEPSNFDHIPTIDLATAAKQERERREMRPLPFSNFDTTLERALSNREMRDKLQTSKRKPVPHSTSPRNSRDLLSVEEPSFAMTSAVQLSPGAEETRRRSPRQPYQAVEPSLSPPIIPSKNEARTPKSAPIQAATTVLVPPPRSAKRPPPPIKLQSRTTKDVNALPAVSRFSVSTMDPMTARIASSMFSPQEQKKSMAPMPPRQTLPAPPVPVIESWVDPRTASLPRSNSVKNNIRPSRRAPPSPPVVEEVKETKTPLQRRATVGLPHNPRARATRMFIGDESDSQDRQIMFLNNEEEHVPILVVPAPKEDDEDESPSRKSIIHRPRPIPRKSTASASDLLGISVLPSQDDFIILSTPNLPLISPVGVKTLSESSYGATSAGSLTRRKTVRRTSLVPDMPAVPVEYQGQQPKILEDAAIEVAGTSVWTVVPNDQRSQLPSSDKKTQRALCVSKFSIDTSLTTEEPRASYNSRMSVNTMSSYEETIGRNSVVFASDAKATPISALVNSLTERPLKHESVDSEFSMMLRMAPVPPKTVPTEKQIIQDDKMIEAPFVLDMSQYESSSASASGYQSTAKQLVSWHHRVGEELPSFSSQLKNRRSRKLLVPKPLALYRPANVTVVIEAEPSPVEPDQEALDRIHEQLRQFDADNGDSRATISEQQRMTILANLESEMGAQESQWQMLKVDLGPSSPSTIVSSPGINSIRSSVDIGRFEMVPITKLNATAGDLIVALKEEANKRLSRSSDQSIKEDMLETGDDRLNRRSLSASGRMSLVSVVKGLSQIGSPTPPDTDESGEDSDNDSMVEGTGSAKDLSTGLMPRSQVSTVTSFLPLDEVVNTPTENVKSKLDVPVEFEDVSLLTPKAQPPLVPLEPEIPKTAESVKTVENVQPVKPVKQAEPETIRFSLADLEQPVPRPRSVTRRPPRQSKRISALPDIVENPEPLAGKSGSLGIFQFAWGEKSDSARAPPRMTGLSGTMSSGRGRMNMNPVPVLLSSVQESSAPAHSFLDDDDEADNGLEDYEDEDYDDGFDEATLWEIASLLESDLDNRDDLFMVGEDENWEDQASVADDVSPASSPVEEVPSSAKEEVFDFIPVTLAPETNSDLSLQAPTLWTDDKKGRATRFLGLPQPSEGSWKYSTVAPRSARAIPRVMEEPAQLSSTSLWMVAAAPTAMYTSRIWCAPTTQRVEKGIKVINATKSLIWSLPSPTIVSSLGVGQPDIRLWGAYILPATRSVRRTTRMPRPATIVSTSLWTMEPIVEASMSKGVWSPVSKREAKPPKTAVPSVWAPLSLTNINLGLPQPAAGVWSSYILPAARAARTSSRMPQPAKITSTTLWKLKSIANSSASTGVWSPAPKEAVVDVASLVIAPSIWSPIPVTRRAFGLPQPNIQVWSTYIQLESRVARRSSRKEQQLTTQSARMWSAESLRTVELVSTKLWILKKTTLLWAPSAPKGASIGLPQPDDKIWNTYIVSPSRSIRHKANDFKYETITSASLWEPLPAVIPKPGGVWKPMSLPVELVRESRSDSTLKVAKELLWSVSSTKVPSAGLPQPDAMTWSMYLLPASRSNRSAYLSKPIVITSTSLWAPTSPTEPSSSGVWKPKSLVPSGQAVMQAGVPHVMPTVEVARGLLWSSCPAKTVSLGLPQPDAKLWTTYFLPADRSHQSAYVPRVILISSTSLWSPPASMETQSGGVWKPKSKLPTTEEKKTPQQPVKTNKAALWTPPIATKKPSFGLPQPDPEVWQSYLSPITRPRRRNYLSDELPTLKSHALWSPPPLKKTAAPGYLWQPSETQAEKKRPTIQTAIRSVETPSPAASSAADASPVSAISTRAAGVRTSTPVLMTQEQWKLAFKRISQDVSSDAAAAPSNHASTARPTRLNRSQSVKSRPVFDPSVMALISELPSPRQQHQGLGRSKSVSFLPPSRKPSHGSSASLPNAEPSQPATSSLI